MGGREAFQAKLNGLVHPDVLRVMLLKMVDIVNPIGQEEALARFVGDRFAEIGADVSFQEADPVKRRSNVVAILRGAGDGPILRLTAPLDSQIVFDATGHPKRAGWFDGEWIHGIGAAAMKSAFAVYFGAMRAIKQGGQKLRGDIVMTATVSGGGLVDEFRGDVVMIASPTGLRVFSKRHLATNHPLVRAVHNAHRAIFFGREPPSASPGIDTWTTDETIVNDDAPFVFYGPAGVDRENAFSLRDKELGEIVSVPNLVMCAKVYALTAFDICSRERSAWLSECESAES